MFASLFDGAVIIMGCTSKMFDFVLGVQLLFLLYIFEKLAHRRANSYLEGGICLVDTNNSHGVKAQYDHAAKMLLANKNVLARILIGTVDEFRGMEPDVVKGADRKGATGRDGSDIAR